MDNKHTLTDHDTGAGEKKGWIEIADAVERLTELTGWSARHARRSLELARTRWSSDGCRWGRTSCEFALDLDDFERFLASARKGRLDDCYLPRAGDDDPVT